MSKAGWKKLEQHEGEDGTVCVIRMEASSGRFKATVGPDHTTRPSSSRIRTS